MARSWLISTSRGSVYIAPHLGWRQGKVWQWINGKKGGMWIQCFWSTQIMIFSVSCGSHGTWGPVAQGSLMFDISMDRLRANLHPQACTVPRERGETVPRDVEGPKKPKCKRFRQPGTAVTAIRPCHTFCCCLSPYHVWLLLPLTPTSAWPRQHNPPTRSEVSGSSCILHASLFSPMILHCCFRSFFLFVLILLFWTLSDLLWGLSLPHANFWWALTGCFSQGWCWISQERLS